MGKNNRKLLSRRIVAEQIINAFLNKKLAMLFEQITSVHFQAISHTDH